MREFYQNFRGEFRYLYNQSTNEFEKKIEEIKYI